MNKLILITLLLAFVSYGCPKGAGETTVPQGDSTGVQTDTIAFDTTGVDTLLPND